jgi:hypothetical protein
MPNAQYRFTRKDGIEGFLSKNRPSTDALGALHMWREGRAEREFTVQVDEDEQLVAELSWNEADGSAGQELDAACGKLGVTRTYEGT